MAKLSAYYPHDADEETYMRWLEAPGDGLGMMLGDAPSVEEIINRGGTVHISKSKKQEEPPKLVIKAPKKKCSRCGGTEWNDIRAGLGDCCMKKALPKKDKSSAPAAKAKQAKAGKQKAGATGKVRSSYPQETSGSKKPQQQQQQQQKPKKPNPPSVPEDEEGPPTADPNALATMLGMPVTSLQRIAQRFKDNKKLGGRGGFVTFMKTRLKGMASKHKLDGDYFGLIFDALCPKKPNA